MNFNEWWMKEIGGFPQEHSQLMEICKSAFIAGADNSKKEELDYKKTLDSLFQANIDADTHHILEKALVGFGFKADCKPIAVYDARLAVSIIQEKFCFSYDEAVEHFDKKIIVRFEGENAPLFLFKTPVKNDGEW